MSSDSKLRKRDKLREAVVALKDHAAIKPKNAETAIRLLESVLPTDETMPSVQTTRDLPVINKPNFNLALMGSSFRRFNARIGIVFVFLESATHLLTWTHPTQTISFGLAVSFLILHPRLIPMVPFLIALFGILIPAYLSRHPPPPNPTLPQLAASIDGPPLAPAKTIAPAADFSSDFARNMRDLQNAMTDFADGHDAIVDAVAPATNFSDEARSSAVFLVMILNCGAIGLFGQFVPWRPLILITVWVLLALGHPAVQIFVLQHYEGTIRPTVNKLNQQFEDTIIPNIVLDATAETREVEIFELQRRRGASAFSGSTIGNKVIEYEPWVFSPSSWEPRTPGRVAGARTKGTRFFEDVAAPEGWEWQSKKWRLDLDNKEWVEARMLGDVEVETEGERWVYDVEDSGDATKRGEWRRRRWVRMVRRKVYSKQELMSPKSPKR